LKEKHSTYKNSNPPFRYIGISSFKGGYGYNPQNPKLYSVQRIFILNFRRIGQLEQKLLHGNHSVYREMTTETIQSTERWQQKPCSLQRDDNRNHSVYREM